MNRNELDGSPIPELGYAIDLICNRGGDWNLWSIHIQCAVYCGALFNCCKVTCANINKSPRSLDREEWMSIADTQIRCWRPDGGCLTSSELESPHFIVRPVNAGWITYLSKSMLAIDPELPAGVSLHRIPRRGTIFDTWPVRLTNAKKSDVGRVKSLATSLKRAASGKTICE
jgi:hypothetical protein